MEGARGGNRNIFGRIDFGIPTCSMALTPGNHCSLSYNLVLKNLKCSAPFYEAPIRHESCQTTTVNRLGRKIFRAIKGQEIMAIQERHRFQRLAALQLPKDALEDWAEPLGGDGIKDLAHLCVARDTLDPVDGVHMALGPLLVKGEERRRFEGTHGERGHQGIR